MKMYLSNFRENASNTQYPNETTITDFQELLQAVKRDHIAPQMQNWHRGKDDFLQADCIMLDMDNTHSDDPADWQSIDDIIDAFPDVTFYYIQSRNHMKEKIKTAKDGTVTRSEPRPKYHLYFPLARTYTSHSDYEAIMLKAAGLYPYFDLGAAKPAQFFFGVAEPAGGMEQGTQALDDYVNSQPKEAVLSAVNDFWEKVKTGQYKNGSGSETEKALTRLYNYLGVTRQATPAAEKQPAATWSEYSAEQYSPLGEEIARAEQQRSLQWFERFAQEHGIDLGKRYRIESREHPQAIVICVSCPWEDEHSMTGAENEAVVIIDLGGKLNFLCRHSHGARYGWKEYKAYYEEKALDEAIQRTFDSMPDAGSVEKTEDDKAAQGAAAAGDDIDKFLEKIQTEAYKPYKTGLQFFDDLLGGGVIRQTLLLVMAAPGAGKTTLCQQIAEAMAENNNPVIYLNFEMSREQMIAKAISSRLSKKGVLKSATDILQGYRWSDGDRKQITEEIAAYKEQIYPYLKYNPGEIGTKLENVLQYLESVGRAAKEAEKQAPVVVVDYLHLLTAQKLELQELIKQAVTGLKNYAKNYDTFVIAIMATNRDSNKAGQFTMESGRDSSNLEYTGDYMLSLNYYDLDKGEKKTATKLAELQRAPIRNMIIRILKHRLGVPGKSANIYFHAAGNRFYGENELMPKSLLPYKIPFDDIPFD